MYPGQPALAHRFRDHPQTAGTLYSRLSWCGCGVCSPWTPTWAHSRQRLIASTPRSGHGEATPQPVELSRTQFLQFPCWSKVEVCRVERFLIPHRWHHPFEKGPAIPDQPKHPASGRATSICLHVEANQPQAVVSSSQQLPRRTPRQGWPEWPVRTEHLFPTSVQAGRLVSIGNAAHPS